jgi:hypothetical protein
MSARGALAGGESKNQEPTSKQEEGGEQTEAKVARAEMKGGQEADEQEETEEEVGTESDLNAEEREKEQEQEKEEDQDQEQEQEKEQEEALKDVLGREREEAVRAEHPEGEVFFGGNAEEIAEVEAEEMARGQLARSGLLRGQRVRVAD